MRIYKVHNSSSKFKSSSPSGNITSVIIYAYSTIITDVVYRSYILQNTINLLMKWAGNMTRMGEGRGVHRVLVGKPEGKRPMGRPRCRWEDNIKMDLQQVGGCFGDWVELAQGRGRWRALVSAVMNFRFP
jgi:hypothetical protein